MNLVIVSYAILYIAQFLKPQKLVTSTLPTLSAWLLMQIRLKVTQLPYCKVYHPLFKSPYSLLKYSQELVCI
jgi:hypothetical protein